jgi:rubrerythrin
MVGIAEVKAGYDGAKAALDILKGVQSLQSEAAKNEAVIDVQRHVIEAQQGLSTSLKRIDELEEEVARLTDWTAQKGRYELADTGQGSLAYRLREGLEPPEPQHWICPQCYEDGKKSILKTETLFVGRAETLVCHRCGFDVVVRGVRHNQNTERPRGAAFRR